MLTILSFFYKLLLIGLAIFILWFLYQFIKQKKELFTPEAINKSFATMGILAIGLIIIIGLTVVLLRSN